MIVHNCHALSKPAWQALLKLLEEPPDHLYIALCTTELQKIPETIVTRCYHVVLRPLKPVEIEDLLIAISELEGWEVSGDVIQAIVQASTGQPRKAISLLQSCHDAPSKTEVSRIISLMDASEPVIELVQHLLAGKRSWTIVRALLAKIEPDAFEDAAISTGRYICAALLAQDNDKRAAAMWSLLEALLFPAETLDRKVGFITAVGRIMWGGGA